MKNNILVVGYGNIGKHVVKEFEKFKPAIYDPFISDYSEKPTKRFDFAFICVPTDSREDGSCDTSIVESVVLNTDADIIVIKSTVPVGTSRKLAEKCGNKIIFSPEYWGTTQHVKDNQDFVILSGYKKDCDAVAQLYTMIKDGSFSIRYTDYETAELAKYMENCFLALKVTFCAEFYQLAKNYGLSYNELRELFILDGRMGKSHTFVYEDHPFYDSHCLNKDIPALVNFAKDSGIEARLMSSVHEINIQEKNKNKMVNN